jgi:hypothetical protein
VAWWQPPTFAVAMVHRARQFGLGAARGVPGHDTTFLTRPENQWEGKEERRLRKITTCSICFKKLRDVSRD